MGIKEAQSIQKQGKEEKEEKKKQGKRYETHIQIYQESQQMKTG